MQRSQLTPQNKPLGLFNKKNLSSGTGLRANNAVTFRPNSSLSILFSMLILSIQSAMAKHVFFSPATDNTTCYKIEVDGKFGTNDAIKKINQGVCEVVLNFLCSSAKYTVIKHWSVHSYVGGGSSQSSSITLFGKFNQTQNDVLEECLIDMLKDIFKKSAQEQQKITFELIGAIGGALSIIALAGCIYYIVKHRKKEVAHLNENTSLLKPNL